MNCRCGHYLDEHDVTSALQVRCLHVNDSPELPARCDCRQYAEPVNAHIVLANCDALISDVNNCRTFTLVSDPDTIEDMKECFHDGTPCDFNVTGETMRGVIVALDHECVRAFGVQLNLVNVRFRRTDHPA